ncbi:MAG: diaminopimelate decarboxylase [Thermoanaerobacteraceae bacterium]|nr:diaminopimelate decarboxylase [Thermoanaerobacteraceae bacterium]
MIINAKGHLEIGGIDAVDLAREFGTPLYCIDEKILRSNINEYKLGFKDINSDIAYAGKAFLTVAMCQIIKEENLSLDVVSGGELYTAMKASFDMKRIFFHGNNKDIAELDMAVRNRVGRIVVDNYHELDLLEIITQNSGKQQDILLRLSPGIEAHTHSYISTGQIDSKFGFGINDGSAMEAIKKILSIKGLNLKGIHAHIGSQIFTLDSFSEEIKVLCQFLNRIKEETGWEAEDLDIGGGLGIRYNGLDSPPTISEYSRIIVESFNESIAESQIRKPRLIVEPGRSIIGDAGYTLYTVGAIKNIPGIRKYVSVDGGMTDNPRTALYGAKYHAVIANKAGLEPAETVSIAGKCCESGDMLIWDIDMPIIESGDILTVFSTGAYNYSMSSNYNRLPRPAVVLVKDGQARIIVKRETYEDIIRNDIMI